jgi:hypothetical protein
VGPEVYLAVFARFQSLAAHAFRLLSVIDVAVNHDILASWPDIRRDIQHIVHCRPACYLTRFTQSQKFKLARMGNTMQGAAVVSLSSAKNVCACLQHVDITITG